MKDEVFDDELEEKISKLTADEGGRAKGRGKETLFRVTIRNQIDQISIADNKANLIISINTIIISLIVAILGTSLNFSEWPFLQYSTISVPLVILMIFCFASAGFSIMAARPQIIRSKNNPDKINSLLFFGNYQDLELEEYVEKMEGLLKSNRNIYRSMIIDMYYNGKILARKYKLLRYSYTIFFIGLTLCVMSYSVILVF